MKKLLIFAFMLLPMTAFSASSVRVLGSGSNLPGSGSTTKTTTSSARVTPSKAAAPKTTTTTKTGDSTSSRVGTVRAKPKTTTGGTSSTTTAGSRFPVITPAHSYNTVVNPKTGGTTTAGTSSAEVEVIVNAILEDDPRFDMIRINNGSPENKWDAQKVAQRKAQGYVFMWIEGGQ